MPCSVENLKSEEYSREIGCMIRAELKRRFILVESVALGSNLAIEKVPQKASKYEKRPER